MILVRAVYTPSPFQWERFEVVALDGEGDAGGGPRPVLTSFTGEGDPVEAWRQVSAFMIRDPDVEWMSSSSVDDLSFLGPYHWKMGEIEVDGISYEVELLLKDELDIA